MNKNKLYDIVSKMSAFNTHIDEDGDMIIDFDYGSYLLTFDDSDGFLSLTFPNFYAIESYSDRLNVLNICDEINKKVKAVKLYTFKDEVFASVEMFYPKEDEIEKLIERLISVISTALSRFFGEVNKSNDGE